jgi:hypothetical protein
MKVSILLLLGCVAFSASALGASREAVLRDKLGTSVPYPDDVFTTPVAPENGAPSGPVLASRDGTRRLQVFSTQNLHHETPAQFIRRVVDERSQPLTYRRVTRRFFVFTAPVGGQVLYRRCNFARDNVIHCFDVRYPIAEKKQFDPIVTRMSLGMLPR